MDVLADYSFLLYLFLALFLLFFRKRRKVASMSQSKKDSDEGQPLGKKVSWEELMRELKRQTEMEGDIGPIDDTLTEVFPAQEIISDKTVAIENEGDAVDEVKVVVELQESKEEQNSVLLQDKRKLVDEEQDGIADSNAAWAFNSLEDAKRAFVYSEILRPKFND